MDNDNRKPVERPETDPALWQGEVGEETQKVRRARGVVDPEVRDFDDDDITVPPALRP